MIVQIGAHGKYARAWRDDTGVLNFELCSMNGNVLACGYDLTGSLTEEEAIEKMRHASNDASACYHARQARHRDWQERTYSGLQLAARPEP